MQPERPDPINALHHPMPGLRVRARGHNRWMDDGTQPNAPRKRTKQDLVQIFERNQGGSSVKLSVAYLFATDDQILVGWAVDCHTTRRVPRALREKATG